MTRLEGVGSALSRLAWVAWVVVAMALMTQALWDVDYFEPTAEAIAAERRGFQVILVASMFLVAAAVAAYVLFRAPLWATLLIAAPAPVCAGLALSPVIAILGLLVAYPCSLAGIVGCTLLARKPDHL